ncbi:MAG: acyl-CoA dehydrogenase, partial [Alistipes sp.]|nr:acyl-CoA dehydrogenase [Alistipes sp.]
REALKSAGEREQFGKPISQFAAVAEMLKNMEAKTLASRAMLYETARFVDIYKQLNHISQERGLEGEERQEMKFYNHLADGFTPLAKMFASEYANEVAYDSIQIHGGSGYMKDYACERLYRDARIMNIYEGTTQLQVVAAINHVTKGTYLEQIKRYEETERNDATRAMGEKLVALRGVYEQVVERVETLDKECSGYKDFYARRLVEIAGYIILSHIMLRQAGECADYLAPTQVFVKYAAKKITEAASYINESGVEDVELFRA